MLEWDVCSKNTLKFVTTMCVGNWLLFYLLHDKFQARTGYKMFNRSDKVISKKKLILLRMKNGNIKLQNYYKSVYELNILQL